MKKIADFTAFLLGRQSARNAAVINTALSSAGKVLGYARTLLAAYLFGASAFVDAYYVASGSIAFIIGTLERSIEAAVIPKLIQDDGAAPSLFAVTARAVAAFIFALFLLIFIFPGQFINIFARTFDPPRLAYASRMVRYVLPWGAASIAMSLLATWANYQNRFSAPSIVYSLSNIFVISALLLLYPVLKEMALPASQSAGFVILAVLMWFAVGGTPLRPRTEVRPELKRAVCSDALFSMVWSGAIFIYAVVDRYFASSLPVGNVSAISYAQLIFYQPLGLMGSVFTIYFVRASEAAKSKRESEPLFFTTLFMVWSYFFPVAVLLSLLAGPTVKLLLGYGAFDARAVALTAPCLAVTALSLPVLMCNMVVGKYALAEGRLKTLVIWSYIGVAGNIVLDWLLIRPFGAPGLCAATSVMLYISTICLMALFAPGVLKKLIRTLWPQVAAAAVWAAPLYFITREGVLLPLLLGVAAGLAHMLACEKLGLFDPIPERWRLPSIVGDLYRRIFIGNK